MPTARHLLLVLSACLLTLPAASAQSLAARLNQPPAGVEDALRDRVTRFFTLQSEGKFRQAESLVCEDSRDAYYDAHKTRWTSVKLVSISWEDSFQTGKVLMSLGTELKTLAGSMPAQYPFESIWKVRDNAWCYHLPPINNEQRETPFGIMRSSPPTDGSTTPANRPVPPLPSDISRMIVISKNDLHLKADAESNDSLEISNSLSSALHINVNAAARPGLTWALSTNTLKQGEKAILAVYYKPVDNLAKPPFQISLILEPFGSIVNIAVTFTPPPPPPLPQFPPVIKK